MKEREARQKQPTTKTVFSKREKESLRLVRWADDNYPPIDLSNELPAILELIKEIRLLRKQLNNKK